MCFAVKGQEEPTRLRPEGVPGRVLSVEGSKSRVSPDTERARGQ